MREWFNIWIRKLRWKIVKLWTSLFCYNSISVTVLLKIGKKTWIWKIHQNRKRIKFCEVEDVENNERLKYMKSCTYVLYLTWFPRNVLLTSFRGLASIAPRKALASSCCKKYYRNHSILLWTVTAWKCWNLYLKVSTAWKAEGNRTIHISNLYIERICNMHDIM